MMRAVPPIHARPSSISSTLKLSRCKQEETNCEWVFPVSQGVCYACLFTMLDSSIDILFFRLLAIKESKLHRYKPSKPPTSDFVMGKTFFATSLLIISLVLDYYVNQLFVTVIKCPIS